MIYFVIPLVLLALCFLFFCFWKSVPYIEQQGLWAEKEVDSLLQLLPKDEYIILNDLMLPTLYGTTQIDHIVLSTSGVYVIETKDYSGKITGNEKSEQWEQNIYGYRYKTGNALRQNKAHIAAVRYHGHIGKQVPMYNIVVFTHNADFKIYHEEGKVIYLKELLPTIQHLHASEPMLTMENISYIADCLRQQNITDKEQRKIHNQAVHTNKYERREKIENGICPRCGGQLVLREGKYSRFYGCSNYPKCDFTVRSLRTNYDDINACHY